jgi:lipid-A-disaccharide synthase
MVVCYRAHPLTYFLIRPFIHVEHIGMVNIIAGQEICPELIQGDLTPEHLATVIENIARPGAQRDTLLNGLTDVRARMGTGGAAPTPPT